MSGRYDCRKLHNSIPRPQKSPNKSILEFCKAQSRTIFNCCILIHKRTPPSPSSSLKILFVVFVANFVYFSQFLGTFSLKLKKKINYEETDYGGFRPIFGKCTYKILREISSSNLPASKTKSKSFSRTSSNFTRQGLLLPELPSDMSFYITVFKWSKIKMAHVGAAIFFCVSAKRYLK